MVRLPAFHWQSRTRPERAWPPYVSVTVSGPWNGGPSAAGGLATPPRPFSLTSAFAPVGGMIFWKAALYADFAPFTHLVRRPTVGGSKTHSGPAAFQVCEKSVPNRSCTRTVTPPAALNSSGSTKSNFRRSLLVSMVLLAFFRPRSFTFVGFRRSHTSPIPS